MSQVDSDRLYELLPAIHRIKDGAHGEPLRVLLQIMEDELGVVEGDIEGLYENWFIETCQEWVVPYIADLLRVTLPHPVANTGAYSQRAFVANTLRYRRRKGTAAVLEQLARDVTGWPARAVEFFQLLTTSQHLNHPRFQNGATPDLRQTNRLELLDGPFDTLAHTCDVRRIASGRGWHNIPNVGIFLWRLEPYTVQPGEARKVGDPGSGRFTFHPLGLDSPLFNRPQTEGEITHLAEEINVPGQLRRRALFDDLEDYRTAVLAGTKDPPSKYFSPTPVLQIRRVGSDSPVAPEELMICNLSGDWDDPGWKPPDSKTFPRPGDDPDIVTQFAVDPENGRLAVLEGADIPDRLEVTYTYAFSANLGGGPYDRRESLTALLDNREVDWQIGVSQSVPAEPGVIVPTLTEAIQKWNELPEKKFGIIAVMDSRVYQEDLTGDNAIEVPAGSRLVLVAAEWPLEEDDTGAKVRRPGQLVLDGLRPHLLGDIRVRGTAPTDSPSAGVLVVEGLLFEGELRVLSGNLGGLLIRHTTLVPGEGGIKVGGSKNERLEVDLFRTICGPVSCPGSVRKLTATDTILYGPDKPVLNTPTTDASLSACTILGGVAVFSLNASNTIFAEAVVAERRQVGCVRYCWVPEGSRTPRRYRCQPDLALQGIVDPVEAEGIRVRLAPLFTSTEYGTPTFAQLATRCAEEIREGGANELEMGAFYHLEQPHRIANMRAALTEYLPFGLEAGTIFVT